MQRSLWLPRAAALLLAATVIGALGLAVHAAPVQAGSALHPTSCAALGNYPVGARAAAMQAHVASRTNRQPPPSPWRLAGNVILSAFTGCGPPTAGTFSVQGVLMGTPVQQGGITVTVPCAASCLGPALATISAIGTFKQDAAYAHDPLYVTVAATLTQVHAGRPSQVVLTHIMGYLQVAPGQTAALSFFPPPTVRLGSLPLALVLYGWRGM